MGRQIDADVLKQELYQQWFMDILLTQTNSADMFYALAQKIDAQPTAYDTDKVVEQLEDRKSLMLETFKISESDIDRGRIYGMDKAIEIVKGGGVDGN